MRETKANNGQVISFALALDKTTHLKLKQNGGKNWYVNKLVIKMNLYTNSCFTTVNKS